MYSCNDDLPKVHCKDKNPNCESLNNNIGTKCEDNPAYMRPCCRFTCGLCDDFSCKDYKRYCDQLVNPINCNSTQESDCPKSCGKCGLTGK